MLEDLDTLYVPIITTLQRIVKDKTACDSKVLAEAYGHLKVICASEFLAAFETVRYIFGYTKQLSLLLQGSTMDLLVAFYQIDMITNTLQTIRNNATEEFPRIIDGMKRKGKVTDIVIQKPRTCGRQTLRENVESQAAEDYYRRSVFITFIDHVLEELRFGLLVSPKLLR